jgi:ElaA protein
MTITVTETHEIAACRALRRTVFIEEQNVSEADEVDGLDDVALHLIAKDGNIPIGTARLIFKDQIAKVQRVCVLKAYRGQGHGQALMRAAVEVARAKAGVSHARLGAQLHALGFYERLGFVAFGPVFDDAGIQHRDMELAL